MNIKRKEKGFTIIEVVLVLAIAGLIFSMVFVALPALQRSQRDTQRKHDMSRLGSALVNYTSNNRGAIPTDWTTPDGVFVKGYLTTSGDSFIDPSGANTKSNQTATTYTFSPSTKDGSALGSFADNQNIIYYSEYNICDSNTPGNVTTTGAGSRKVAFRMVLEGGGVYCSNN